MRKRIHELFFISNPNLQLLCSESSDWLQHSFLFWIRDLLWHSSLVFYFYFLFILLSVYFYHGLHLSFLYLTQFFQIMYLSNWNWTVVFNQTFLEFTGFWIFGFLFYFAFQILFCHVESISLQELLSSTYPAVLTIQPPATWRYSFFSPAFYSYWTSVLQVL